MKNKKIIITIAALALVGVLLIILGNLNLTDAGNQAVTKEYEKEIEEKLEMFLLKIEGINKAKVIVSVEQYDIQANVGVFGTNEENSQSFPAVRGVAIACTNGGDSKVKLQIISLVSAYLGIPTNRIEVIDIK